MLRCPPPGFTAARSMLERRIAQDARPPANTGDRKLLNPKLPPASPMKKKARDKPALAEDGERRKRFILEIPITLGAHWALDSSRNVALEGRRIEGGWPGTVPEARARVKRELTLELEALGFSPPTETELLTATATAYERARHEWHGRGTCRGRSSWQRLGRAHDVERSRAKPSRAMPGT